MGVLQIPEEHVDGLIKIQSLDDNQVNELEAGLLEAPPVMWAKQLTKLLVGKVSTIPEEDLSEILEILIGMSLASYRLDLPTSEFVKLIVEAMEQGQNERLKFVRNEREQFSNSLTKLLSVESLVYPAKGFGILSDHERVFVDARTLTDVRPIFGSDTELSPKAAVIMHMLHVTYQRSGESENLYLAMDSNDVKLLVNKLQRSLSKAMNLEKMLNASGIICLNSE